MPTQTTREYKYQSGTGSDAYTFKVLVDASSHYFIDSITTPMGAFSFDTGSLPESVVRDMVTAINTIQAL